MASRNAESTTNYHVEYMDVTQHWSPDSERYAGGDALLTALNNGWKIRGEIRREEHWFAGMRLIYIYHIDLERDGKTMTMRVLHNPYINRMLSSEELQVVPLEAQNN